MNNFENEVWKRNNINERKAVRRPCKIFTDFLVNDRACIGVISNISPFGAFIKSLDIFQADETVRMVIKTKNVNLKRHGIIRWNNHMGFGLQFADT